MPSTGSRSRCSATVTFAVKRASKSSGGAWPIISATISTQRGIELPIKMLSDCSIVMGRPISVSSSAHVPFEMRSLSTSTPSQSKITPSMWPPSTWPSNSAEGECMAVREVNGSQAGAGLCELTLHGVGAGTTVDVPRSQ